jgi:hypothetical protein
MSVLLMTFDVSCNLRYYELERYLQSMLYVIASKTDLVETSQKVVCKTDLAETSPAPVGILL